MNDFISTSVLKDMNNEKFNNFKNTNKEVKHHVSSMILLVINYLKCDGNGDNIKMISHNVHTQEKMNDFVRIHNMSFIIGKIILIMLV